MKRARLGVGVLLACLMGATTSCKNDKGDRQGSGRIVGRLGGAPTSAQLQSALSVAGVTTSQIGVSRSALSSVANVQILLTDAGSGDTIASATSSDSGVFTFEAVPAGQYKLKIEQDEFAETAYAVDSETVVVDDGSIVSVGLPVVKRVLLPSFPQLTMGRPVALDAASGRIYMAVDQGILVLHPVNDTVDLLYRADGFRSQLGPRLLTFVTGTTKLLIITPSHIGVIDAGIFVDDTASEVLNYDDPGIQAQLGDNVTFFDVDPSTFIDTGRTGDTFDPHYYRFDFTADGSWVYMAAGEQAAVIDWQNQSIERVFKSSGRMAHYAPTSDRLFFLQGTDKVRIIDAATLLEVATYDLAEDSPYRLLGVSSRPSTGDGYISYTRLSTSNEEVLFLLVVDADGQELTKGRASTLLGAADAEMELGVPHWLDSGERFILGDSLFEFAGGSFLPLATGAIINSSLGANGVTSNTARSADVPHAILVSYLGGENAALGFYFLDQSNPDVGIRVVRGTVPVVTLDEQHGRGVVFGNGAMSIIYYNATDAAGAESEVDLRGVGEQLLGGGSGQPCSSAEPCPDGGICAPVDEFNTDEGTCTPQNLTPFKVYCGGIGAGACDEGFECDRDNPTNPQSAGRCRPLACDVENACPEGFYCAGGDSMCPPGDPQCADGHDQTSQCQCLDLSLCGPSCAVDTDCPVGFICSASGHCSIDRCLSDASCPAEKVCGFTELGRACVVPGTGSVGDSCISPTECATAFCRAGACATTCSKTSDCGTGEECMGGEAVGYCAPVQCGCGADQICYPDGMCREGANCATAADCQLDQVCVEGRCRTTCAASADCADGEFCRQGHFEVPLLYCAPDHEIHCWQSVMQTPGCAPDRWCSDWGMCLTGTPCYDWMPGTCGVGQTCLAGACQTTCTSSAECEIGDECTGGNLYNPATQGMVFTCQSASCNCPHAGDLCIAYDLGRLGECWDWTSCTDTGLCGSSDYGCHNAMDGNYHCRCDNLPACGPRCDSDAQCELYHVCNLGTGQCELDSCAGDADCTGGKVCGLTNTMQRACITPGTRLLGAPCDQPEQCTTGACLWSQGAGNNTCSAICTTSADCGETQTCALNQDWMPAGDGGIRVCVGGGRLCAPHEFALDARTPATTCTDGTRCDMMPGGDGGCSWPTQCWDGLMSGYSYCVCHEAVCQTTCADASACGDIRLICLSGRCRPRPSCNDIGDCTGGDVCGLLDGYENDGPMCVPPGGGADGAACQAHAGCASGFCNGDLCAARCDVTSDCASGECAATSVAGGLMVIGVCGAATCGCGADEVCSPAGTCGAGPLCNDDTECAAGQTCALNLCRPVCTSTAACNAGEDCTQVAAGAPLACVAESCGCADSDFCVGGVCLTAQTCTDSTACAGGQCIGGLCFTKCTSTAACAAGLECVAVPVNPGSSAWNVRVCTAPACNCANAATWCIADSRDAVGCYRGNDCTGCTLEERCVGVTGIDSVGSACYDTCASDAECSLGGTVCGLVWNDFRGCVYPGTGAAGDTCANSGDCASGVCADSRCVAPCHVTGDCASGEVCGAGNLPPHIADGGLRQCYTSTLRCTATEWAVGNSCTDGTIRCDGDAAACQWPTFCSWTMGGNICACTDAVCLQSCADASACGNASLTCIDGLCRLRPSCGTAADCVPGEVCGLVDGAESLGARCVDPGTAQVDESCALHADCASGQCSNDVCAERCQMTGDCSSGECQAVAVGIGVVVGACGPAACGCAADEVCNGSNECGPAPLCNDDCGTGETCVDNLCRAVCTEHDDCAAGEDCTLPGGGKPPACLPETCSCGTGELCIGGACFAARPCADDIACGGGRCITGQCFDRCTATSQCGAGLECVTVQRHDNSFTRVCTAPTCNCRTTDSWCTGTLRVAGGMTNQCVRGSDCTCSGSFNECTWFDGGCAEDTCQACKCTDLAVCGPLCDAHSDCPSGWTCDTGTNACILTTCTTDAGCPAGTICGRHPTQMDRLACRVPGPTPSDSSCQYDSQCASGWCRDFTCQTLCRATDDCPAGKECRVQGGVDNLLSRAALCRDPYCNCRAAEDVCVDWAPMGESGSWGKWCMRLTSCAFPAPPCSDQTGTTAYWCDNNAWVCSCNDGAVCGTVCTSHSDCDGGQVCMDGSNTCQQVACSRDADCPTGAICPFNYWWDSRSCAPAGSVVDGLPCSHWSQCQSGMCWQNVCRDPCVDNSECLAGTTCKMPVLTAGNSDFPFCFDWAGAGLGCAGCADPSQFCDGSSACHTGPACWQASPACTMGCNTSTLTCY